MRAALALASLNGRFTYRSDKADKWQILRDVGQVWGDCEDFSLTLLWLAVGRSLWRFWWALLTFQAVIWFSRSPKGNNHAMIWLRGHGWTDNIQREFLSRKDLKAKGYRLLYPYPAPTVALKMLIGRFV